MRRRRRNIRELVVRRGSRGCSKLRLYCVGQIATSTRVAKDLAGTGKGRRYCLPAILAFCPCSRNQRVTRHAPNETSRRVLVQSAQQCQRSVAVQSWVVAQNAESNGQIQRPFGSSLYHVNRQCRGDMHLCHPGVLDDSPAEFFNRDVDFRPLRGSPRALVA